MYDHLALLSLHCCTGFSLVVIIAVAPHVAEHRPQGLWASVVATRELSRCGSWTLEHVGLVAPQHMGLLGSGIEPVSPALLGRFSTTEPPRKPLWMTF